MTPSSASRASFHAAADLWAVRVLNGFGTSLSARTFQALVVVGGLVAMPVVAALGLLGTSVTGALLSEPDLEPRVLGGLATILVGGCGYVAALDLIRTHFGRAAYAVSDSPARGLWIAADIPLAVVVLVERGGGLLLRAAAHSAVIFGSARAVAGASAGDPGMAAMVDDLLTCSILGPAAYLCAGLALALTHARREAGSRRRHRWAGATLALGISAASGAALGLAYNGSLSAASIQQTAQLSGIALHLGGLRLALGAALGLAIAALVIALAGTAGFVAAHQRTISREREGAPPRLRGDQPLAQQRAVTAILWRGVGGLGSVSAGTRAVLGLACLAIAVLGWRVAGGVALPAAMAPATASVLVFLGIACTMTVSAVTLMRLGLTRLLWQMRALTEAGVPAATLYWAGAAPAAIHAGVAGVAVTVLGLALGIGVPVGALLAIAATFAVEHLVDPLCARTDAGEGRRAGDSVLALLGFVSAVPVYLLALSGSWLAHLSLAALTCLAVYGGLSCFTLRLRRLPVRLLEERPQPARR